MTDKQTILIVEDEAGVALALGKVLEDEGFTVLTEADGEAGWKTAVAKHPDLILTDLKMPKMTGMEMIKELRKDEWGKNAKIIILSNVSDVAMLEEAMSQNAFQYLVKGDTSMEGIVEKVRAQLGVSK